LIVCVLTGRGGQPETTRGGGGGGRAPLRPGWAHGPGAGLSPGGLLVASCQRQWGGEGVLY